AGAGVEPREIDAGHESGRLDEHLPIKRSSIRRRRVLLGAISRLVIDVEVDDAGDDEVRAGARAEVLPVVARAFERLHVRARKARLRDVDDLQLRRLVELLAEIAVELRLHVDLRRAVALLL